MARTWLRTHRERHRRHIDRNTVVSPRQRARLATLAAALPRGGALLERSWRARHHGVVVLLWFHVAALVVLGALLGKSLAALPAPAPDVDLRGLVAATAVIDRGHLGQVLTLLFTTRGAGRADDLSMVTVDARTRPR